MATKGSKQIVEENVSTLKFYRNMCFGACAIYFLVMFLLTDSFGGVTIVSRSTFNFGIKKIEIIFSRLFSNLF